jgi:hypothetical protein
MSEEKDIKCNKDLIERLLKLEKKIKEIDSRLRLIESFSTKLR